MTAVCLMIPFIAQGSVAMTSVNASQMTMHLLSDFTNGETSGWQLSTDRVMGGVSQGAARLVGAGPDRFAHLTGNVSTDNNGGFIQIRKRFALGFAQGFDGVILRVRGNTETYGVHLRNQQSVRPWMNYRQSFTVSEEWQDIILPFEAFLPSRPGIMPEKIDVDTVFSLGVVAFGGDFTADLQIQHVGFYKQNRSI